MNDADRDQIKQLLAEAAKLDPAMRREFIQNAAASPGVMAEALDLLPSLGDAGFMSSPTGAGMGAADPSIPPFEAPGMRIGRYKLLQRVGEGGFGMVFMAEQVEPVVRRVALKIIKAGMDTRQVIARFEAERQALAMMDHPNIARVLDAGATEHGRPYFVMEMVRGEPVTNYCDRQQLGIEDRLMLFRDICGAVQHAHQKGIIHRDIKPSNVLVTIADGRPMPKVIDFGIAKATAVRLTDKTLFTEIHQLIGTPEYMSPEQAEVSGVDVDTRSDVYSLGVLLYELLAGSPPFDSRRLRSAPFAEIQRIIRDEEPPRPSLRLRTLASSSNIFIRRTPESAGQPSTDATALEIAKRRRTEPSALTNSLRGDLDWIVMKCLEKDRARRYETASALAGDVTAYLAHKPVSAMPPSATYKFRKLVFRHRAAFIAGAAIAATLVIATIISIMFALKASQALTAEAAQRALADKRAAETRQVAQFQSDLLSEVDLEVLGRGFRDMFRAQVQDGLKRQFVGQWPNRKKLTPTEIADQLAEYDRITVPVETVDIARHLLADFILKNHIETVNKKFANQPRVQADLLSTLGSIYHNLGLNDQAEPALRTAVDLHENDNAEDAVALADSLADLAGTLADSGRLDEAVQLHRRALAIFRQRLGNQDAKTVNSLDLLGRTLFEKGENAEAEASLRESIALARNLPDPASPQLASALASLGGMLLTTGDSQEAERLIREALELRRKQFGNDSKEVADCLNNLAGTYYLRDDYAGAEKILREALEISRKVVGNESVKVATILNNIASARFDQDDPESAKQLFAESLEMYRRILGDEHPDVTSTLNNLAMIHQMTGDLKTAEPLLREALDLRRAQLGNDHADVALSLSNLGYQMLRQKDPAAAEPFFREAIAIYDRKFASNHATTLSARLGMVQCLAKIGKADEAETILTSISASPGFEGIPAYLKKTYLTGYVLMYEAKDRASPGQGFDKLAAEWKAKSTPASQPATSTSAPAAPL